MPISTWENLISCHWPGFAFVVSQIGWPRLVLTINVRGCKLILPQKITFHFLSIKIQHQSQFLYSNRIHAQILTNSNFSKDLEDLTNICNGADMHVMNILNLFHSSE